MNGAEQTIDSRGIFSQATPVQISWQLYRLAGRLDWRDWLKRLDIYRYMEYAGTLQQIRVAPGASVLDVGSANSVLPVFLAMHGFKVLAVDIDDRRLEEQSRRLPKLEEKLFPRGQLRFEHADVTALSFADDSFDLVTAISMIEHLAGDGDKSAMREMSRVARPGGQVLLTVPYGVTFYPGRPPQSTSATQREYDEVALMERLVEPSSLTEKYRWYIVDRGFGFERKIWRRIPIQVHLVTGWTGLGLVCAQIFLRNSNRPDGRPANAAGLSLIKV